MPNKSNKKILSYFFVGLSGIIGVIGSLVSIWSVFGYFGIIVSITISLILLIIGYKFYTESSQEERQSVNMNIVTHGNQSPGVVTGNYQVFKNERPRTKN